MDPLRLLFATDDAALTAAFVQHLQATPYVAETTASPDKALHIAARMPIAVALADFRLAGDDGAVLLREARSFAFDTTRLLLARAEDLPAAQEAVTQGAAEGVLLVPWQEADLLLSLRQATDRYALSLEIRRLREMAEKREEAARASQQVLQQQLETLAGLQEARIQTLDDTVRGAIEALLRLQAFHHLETGNHARRVAALAHDLAVYLGVAGEALLQVEAGAALHDLGKTKVAAGLLRKPTSALTPAEQFALSAHPNDGAALVRLMPSLKAAARLILHHHERFDGTGYPDRIAGHDIPLGARIIAVADAYDRHLYPPGITKPGTPAEAVRTVEAGKSTAFDPVIIAALADIVTPEARKVPIFEETIDLHELRPGMVMARDVVSHRRKVLLTRGTQLKRNDILALLRHHIYDTIPGPLFVQSTA